MKHVCEETGIAYTDEVEDGLLGGCGSITRHAVQKLGEGHRAFVATYPDGRKSYVLFDPDGQGIYENANLEQMHYGIDYIRLSRDMKAKESPDE